MLAATKNNLRKLTLTSLSVFHFKPFTKSFKDDSEGVFKGATDADHEGSFIWDATREPITYRNWQNSQPDNFLSREHCTHMSQYGQWNDLNCDEKYDKQMAMCQKLLPAERKKFNFNVYLLNKAIVKLCDLGYFIKRLFYARFLALPNIRCFTILGYWPSLEINYQQTSKIM